MKLTFYFRFNISRWVDVLSHSMDYLTELYSGLLPNATQPLNFVGHLASSLLTYMNSPLVQVYKDFHLYLRDNFEYNFQSLFY